MLEIIINNSIDLSDKDWDNYTTSFNSVFNKCAIREDFKNKYLKTIDGKSYHSFLMSDHQIVGSFTVIPVEYIVNEEKLKFGLSVDVFVLKEYRSNPLLILKMYKKLRIKLIQIGVTIVIGVPNDLAYSYWKKVLKWNDIGHIPYYLLPVNAGSVFLKAQYLLNTINKLILKVWIGNKIRTNTTEVLLPIHINRENTVIEDQRYSDLHKKVIYSNVFFSYRLINEKGIKTCYLIDFYNTNTRLKDKNSIQELIKYILETEDIDLILYIGQINFKQRFLLKVPFNYEPKHLYFAGDILVPERVNEKLVFNYKNWDFGLFNYDVR